MTLVTVTYGRRWHLLERVLDAAFSEGVHRAVVIDNASLDPIATNAAVRYGGRVSVIPMKGNRGSAPAFKRGIEHACNGRPEFLLLLDDDNVLAPGSLAILRDTYEELHAADPTRLLVVLAFRPDNQADIAKGSRHRVLARDAFVGFDLRQLPARLVLRLVRPRAAAATPAARAVLDVAPYGGMFFPPSVVDVIGLPNADLVLYGDDTEFSWRVTMRDGRLVVATGARITDVEVSWNLVPTKGSGLKKWLTSGTALSSYYALRNRVYFETHHVPHSAFWRRMNRAVVLAAWRYWSRKLGAAPRLELVLQAVADGEASRLGIKEGLELR